MGLATRELHTGQRGGTKNVYSDKSMSTTLCRKCMPFFVFWWYPSTIIIHGGCTQQTNGQRLSPRISSLLLLGPFSHRSAYTICSTRPGACGVSGIGQCPKNPRPRNIWTRGTSHPSSEDSHRSRRCSFPGLPQA